MHREAAFHAGCATTGAAAPCSDGFRGGHRRWSAGGDGDRGPGRRLKLITHYPSGGLGNQLFDYAAVRSLADRKGSSLLLDASLLAIPGDAAVSRTFLLDRFPVRARFRSIAGSGQKAPIWKRLLRRVREDLGATRVHRDRLDYRYYDGFWDIPPRAIIRGHFLSPKFFASNIPRIRADLKREAPSVVRDAHGLAWLERIRHTPNPVAVHVRRGDFLLPGNDWLRLPDVDRYRRRAMDLVRSRCGDARFFVFSDDPDWCREHLAGSARDIEIVSGGLAGLDPLGDFDLIRQCRHVILANSAFSWWAAFLRDRQDGMTLLPARWDRRDSTPIEEMLMPGWQTVE
jgi:hypothetical protein